MPTIITAATTGHRQHPSADAPVPDGVVDIMLWRLAFDVAVEHQRGPDGDCTNLRCTGERGPCAPARQAQRALHLARRRPAPAPPTSPRHTPPSYQPTPAVGRATVPRPNVGRFTGWFTSAATAANRWRPHHYLPQRIPGAALAAA
ncbi:hypothetical protein ABZS66_59315 [Dactylosporangium sp. NPDC005572]|uniref:hypothetical protein n=1 Tax=Dactylosporangium sp. NPDC005572 TaxID=3156889 RepID=UPI0033A87DA4